MRLVGKPFDVLIFLAANQERFVTNEELLHEFWNAEDDTDEEGSDPQNVYKAISKIRLTLGKSSYITTERNRGTRLQGPVTFPAGPQKPEAVTPQPSEDCLPPPRASSKSDRNARWAYVGALMLFVVAGVSFGIASLPLNEPVVISGSPITHTGSPKYAPVIVKGSNIYYTEVAFGQYRVVKINQSSNENSTVATSVPNPYLCDISPDQKSFLLRSVNGGFDDYGPMFIQRADNGTAEALPITALDGCWSSDGKLLTYCRGSEVTVFDLGSKTSRTIARLGGYSWWPRWASDGQHLRFTVSDSQTQLTSIWEVRRDGGGLHQIFN